jgi:hypothetical protein
MRFTKKEQKKKEKQLDLFINQLIIHIENIPKEKAKRDKWQRVLKKLVKNETKQLLGISNPKLESLILDNFMDVADCFFMEAKIFDHSLNIMPIMQAMRNVWIMNLIQVIANKPVEYTPAIFAYSMLYPYTDNFLDDKNIKAQDKTAFNVRLGKRLKGEPLKPSNDHEKKVFSLVEMIEKQYQRDHYPCVYKSLLCIHNGQCNSLDQQMDFYKEEEKNVLCISAEKGGASVLADGYLVCGDMTEKLSDFTFGFGYILQLIDDLQDVTEDTQNNSMTTFVKTKKGVDFDYMTEKLITFTITALNFETNESPYINEVKKLILDHSFLLIVDAIAQNKACFTKQFLKKIDGYSPIRINYLNKVKRKLKRKTRNMQWDEA